MNPFGTAEAQRPTGRCERRVRSERYAFEEKTPSAKGLTDRARRIISLANVRIDDGQGEKRATLLALAVEML